MKYFLLAFLALMFGSQVCFAQKAPILLDEFSATNCCDEGARLDGLAIYLQENPNSKGFVIIYPNQNANSLRKFFQENWVKKYLYYNRGIDKNRITFLRGESRDKYIVQLWTATDLLTKPNFIEANWNYTLPNKRKYQFYTAENDFGPCDSSFTTELFADFLSANPDKKGYISISSNSKSKIRESKDKISKVLFGNYKIPSNRIKFVPVKNVAYPDYTLEEYWFVKPKE